MDARLVLPEPKRGDVLLWRTRTGADLLLRRLDGGRFDHAGLLAGPEGREVLTVGLAGIAARPVAEILAEAETAELRRLRNEDGKFLDDPHLPIKPVLDRARQFLEKADRFVHDPAVHLALVAATRPLPIHPWVSGLSVLLGDLIEPAVASIQRGTLAGRLPLAPAHFVSRCFAESGLKYKLRLTTARNSVLTSAAGLARAAYLAASGEAPPGWVDPGEPARRDLLDAHMHLQRLFAAYHSAWQPEPASWLSENGLVSIPEVHGVRDLEGSPNLLTV